MSKIVRQLLDFSRSRPAAHHPFDLNKLCRETIELLHSVARKANVNLLFDSEQANAIVNADEEQLKQVFINLVVNAIQAMGDGGNVSLTLNCPTGPLPDDAQAVKNQRLDDFFCVEVRDRGTGMTSEQMERIFEPFYTTKEIGRGTGLGLSIAYGIVKDHDGWIDVSGEPDCGSSFRVFLPKETAREASRDV
jgi:signal transduction histidine kinase